jgi:kinesin family protein 4/21/27
LTGTSGIHAKESIDINKSLLVLRKVITALTETKGNDHKFIPYRESKLT